MEPITENPTEPATVPFRPAAGDGPRPAEPSSLRAWMELVLLCWRRQMLSRQMMYIALGLLFFSVLLVAFNTARGRWGMHHWRAPRGRGPTYPAWALQTQGATSAIHRTAGAQGIQTAVLGAVQLVLSPDARDVHGQTVASSGFQVFSRFVVFSIFLSFLLPLWSLAFSIEAIGGERESQSLIWLLSRPLPRWSIYLAKFVALLPWSIGLNVGGFALLCLAGGAAGGRALALFWPPVVMATLTFSALFLLFGAYFRRPAVLAIVYSFCLEVVLGNMPGYLKRVSIGYYARCQMFDRAAGYGIEPEHPGVFLPVSGGIAVVVLVGATAILLGLGMWVFSRVEYHEVD